MKRIASFFVVLLGLSVFQAALGVDAENIRVASKRTPTNTISSTKASSRSGGGTSRTESVRNDNTRSTTNNRSAQPVQSRTTTKTKTIVRQRSTSPVTPNKNSNETKIISTRKPSANSRSVIASRTAVSQKTPVKANVTRTAVAKRNINRAVRAAELDSAKIDMIKTKDYSKCKTVYYECMDEFCANKDTTLRRCACSSHIHDFDDIKKQLSNAEDKMLEFNQRLLTVGLDKEDALSINTASEGEEAFSQKDKSESEKLLKKITDTLNNSKDSKINNNLNAISLDLDVESAWDSVDSISGISTTAKNGLELYNAAQPICLEMAKEICSAEELNIVENSYKLTIQQDCNTVSNAYNSKYNEAMSKIHESGALLDMARLNAYQQRNSDDIFTCKRKILEKLSEPSICGEKLYKCLDITGQYINSADGSAFLSENLYNLTTLLTAPTGDIKWTRVPGNEQFVAFLNSKKQFLKSATEQCKDIADVVWTDFLEDALAQIKLAQNAKLEEIRRSCLKLITECKNTAYNSLSDFDANAISTFAIVTDKTVNGMCADVQNACINLMEIATDDSTLAGGLANLEADISYQSIIKNCTAIGKECIINHCHGTDGDFSLCKNSQSETRRQLLNLEICWSDVFDCVKQANNLNNMTVPTFNFSQQYLVCLDNEDKNICLITHQIWGDCDNDTLSDQYTIKKDDSLLAWLGDNTNTSCKADACPIGYIFDKTANNSAVCNSCAKEIPSTQLTDGYYKGKLHTNNTVTIYDEINDKTVINYCPGGCSSKDKFGNCCYDNTNNKYHISCLTTNKSDFSKSVQDTVTGTGICTPNNNYKAVLVQELRCEGPDNYYCPDYDETNQGKTIYLYCITNDSTFPQLVNNDHISCGDNGHWVLVDEHGNYFNPATKTNNSYTPIYDTQYPMMYYRATSIKDDNDTCFSDNDITKKISCTSKFESDHWIIGNTWNPASNSCEQSISIGETNNKKSKFIISYKAPN